MTAATKRVLIVDDEPAARAQLREVIDGMDELTVVSEVSDGSSAIAAITELTPDIVFLDIDMPEVDGFNVAQATEHLMYQLVFVTAHHQYALQAFDTNAIDYLLKPARPSVIQKCLAKILRQEVLTLQDQPDTAATPNLLLTDSGTTRLVNRDHLLYIEALGRYRRIHLSSEGAAVHGLATLLCDTTLNEFADTLGEEQFVRVHRGFLVNLGRVTSLKSKGRDHEIMLDGSPTPIPVARARVKDLRTILQGTART